MAAVCPQTTGPSIHDVSDGKRNAKGFVKGQPTIARPVQCFVNPVARMGKKNNNLE